MDVLEKMSQVRRERRPVNWKRCNEGVEVELENDQGTTRQQYSRDRGREGMSTMKVKHYLVRHVYRLIPANLPSKCRSTVRSASLHVWSRWPR